MGFSIDIDWTKGGYVNMGRSALERLCTHKDNDQENNIIYQGYCDACDVSEDTADPMMSYGYPVERYNGYSDSISDETIKRIVEQGLTLMENEDTGEVFLALCGGGMDLSGHIAYCYYILEEYIPLDLALCYCKSNLSEVEYAELNRYVINQLGSTKKYINQKLEQLKKELRGFNQI